MKQVFFFPLIAIAIISCLLLRSTPLRAVESRDEISSYQFPQSINPTSSEFSSLITQSFAKHEELRDAWVLKQMNQAVSRGEITYDQSSLILSKRLEMKKERKAVEANPLLTYDQKQNLRKDTQASLDQWSKEKGINLHSLITIV